AAATVCVDVFRATTTAVTAVVAGRRCFPAGSLEQAVPLAAALHRPLLVAEQTGRAYAACLRNWTAAADAAAAASPHVEVVGAGARGEFREEDQICCA